MKRKCRECGEEFSGRSDKIYCSDHCRTTHYNKLNGNSSQLIRSINRTLRKNRRILRSLNPDGKAKVQRKLLLAEGFNFTYHTSMYTTQKGNTYFFCYEQGYIDLDNGYCALVVKQDYAL